MNHKYLADAFGAVKTNIAKMKSEIQHVHEPCVLKARRNKKIFFTSVKAKSWIKLNILTNENHTKNSRQYVTRMARPERTNLRTRIMSKKTPSTWKCDEWWIKVISAEINEPVKDEVPRWGHYIVYNLEQGLYIRALM